MERNNMKSISERVNNVSLVICGLVLITVIAMITNNKEIALASASGLSGFAGAQKMK